MDTGATECRGQTPPPRVLSTGSLVHTMCTPTAGPGLPVPPTDPGSSPAPPLSRVVPQGPGPSQLPPEETNPCFLACGAGEHQALGSHPTLPERLGPGLAGPGVLSCCTGLRVTRTPLSELPGTFRGACPALSSPEPCGSFSSRSLDRRQVS